jgi:alginate O-acetyltransferase complex protein AlgI
MGLGKKVLLANYAGNVADTLLGGTLSLTATGDFWLGVIMFSFQIYFDFSGYSDMAIGLGHIFGFKYSENFNLPYLSKSASEFWRRWHISLGSFFRDYVYIPLGGNRRHQVLNLLVVWFLTGLWHGASWNFVLWGLYFFVLIALEKLAKPLLDKVPGILRWLVTVVLVEFSWVLFYFTDFGRLSEAILAAFGQNGASFLSAQTLVVLKNNLFLILVCILANSAVPRFVGMQLQVLASVPGKALKARENVYSVAVFLFCAALLVLSTIALVGNSYSPFLYFRY